MVDHIYINYLYNNHFFIVDLPITMENHIFLMGKSTISMGKCTNVGKTMPFLPPMTGNGR